MQDRYFTDEELVAYLDGETEHAPVDLIREAVGRNPALARRVAALQFDAGGLAEGYTGLLPAPQSGAPVPAATPAAWPRSASVAAAVALAAGIALGTLIPDSRSAGWVDYVAAYQALYSSSTLSHISAVPDEQASELVRVGAAIGKSISLDRLNAFPEADYKRAQVLSFEGKALIQLAFLTSAGEPLALCIIRSAGMPSDAPELSEMEGMHAAHWSDGAYEYLLIGGSDDALIRRISSGFASTGV